MSYANKIDFPQRSAQKALLKKKKEKIIIKKKKTHQQQSKSKCQEVEATRTAVSAKRGAEV